MPGGAQLDSESLQPEQWVWLSTLQGTYSKEDTFYHIDLEVAGSGTDWIKEKKERIIAMDVADLFAMGESEKNIRG